MPTGLYQLETHFMQLLQQYLQLTRLNNLQYVHSNAEGTVSIGARRHEQEVALAPLPHSENVVKCFSALLVVTTKRSVDELFMHYRYFHNLSSASGDEAAIPPAGLHPWTQTPNLPTSGKKVLRAPMTASKAFPSKN